MTKSCFHLSRRHGAAFGEENAAKYMNSTRLVMRLESVRITSFLETGWLAQPSAHTSATIRKPFLHASYFQH